jgi:Flp pilus assembly pilin Flp
MRAFRRRRGQTTTEYLLTISVVSIAIVGTMLTFETIFGSNVGQLSSHLAREQLINTPIQ